MAQEDKKVLEEKIEEGKKRERDNKLKETGKKLKKSGEGFFADFKKFITKGNVLDLAVAVVIANSFNAIVNGLVKNIITPIMTYFTSGVSINEWKIILRPEVLDEAGAVVTSEIAIQHGLWLQAILDFLIIAFSIFVAVRIIRKAERTLNAREIAKQEAVAAKKKAEDDAKAQAAKELAEKEKTALEEFYANVKEQSALLREIRDSLDKK